MVSINDTYIKDIKYLEEKITLIEYIEQFYKSEDFTEHSSADYNIAPWETSEIKSLDYFTTSLLNIKKQVQEVYCRDKYSYGMTIYEGQLLNDITCIQFDIDQYFRLKGNKVLNQIYMQKYQKQLDDISSTMDKSTIFEINEQLEKFLDNCNKSKINSSNKSILYSKVISIVLKTIEIQISKIDIKQIDLSLIKKYDLEEELLHYIKSSIIEKAMAEEKFDKFTIIEVLDKLNIDDLENPEFWNKFFGIDNAEILAAKSVEDITDTTELSSTDNEIISLSSLQSSLSSTEKLYKLFKKLKTSNIKYRIGIVCRDSINGEKKYKSVKIPFTFSKFKKLIKDCDTLYTFATINEDTGEYENLEIEFGKLENFEITPKKEQIMEVETNYYVVYQEFSSCKNLRKIVLLDNVMQINDFAFSNCYNLTHVILGNRIQSIGKSCFFKTAIEEINIPNSTETLRDSAFYCCYHLKNVHLGNGIKSIGKNCFSNTAIEEIDIPNSTQILGIRAFDSCSNLKIANLGNGIESIDRECFSFTAIEKIDIPNSTETLGNCAFTNCSNLKIANLGNGIKSIGDGCFSFTAIEEFNIPDNIEILGNHAFNNCSNLRIVHLGNGIKSIGDDCFSFTAIEKINIPDNTEILGNHAFGNCSNLRIVHLGNGIKSIGKNCFSNTSLDEINIPDNFYINEEFIERIFESTWSNPSCKLPNKIYTNNYFGFDDNYCNRDVIKLYTSVDNFITVEIIKATIDVPIDEKDRAAEVVSKDIANCVKKDQEIC